VYARRDLTDVVAIAQAALAEAKLRGADYLVLDTAGRLHIDEMRMDELTRLRDTLRPTETLLVVDGMTGQDAVRIGQTFHERLGIDGIVLTKMDGDARGGAALSVRSVTGRPILFLGSGEKPSDIMEFHPDRIASRILGMGDVLSLVERAQEQFDATEAVKLEEKLRKSTFTLEDFLAQLRQMQKMGPLEDLLKMIPGVGSKIKDLEFDPKAMKRVEAIICSMTSEERRNPKIVNGSRRKRISRGSGTSVQEVNQLLKRFSEMSALMKKFSKGKGRPRLPFAV
jgi:signal recognition particle subunit SRP54